MEAGCGMASSTPCTSVPTASTSRTATTRTGTQTVVPLNYGTLRLSNPVFVSKNFSFLTNVILIFESEFINLNCEKGRTS